MSFLVPLWMQNGTYPARLDRQLVRESFGEREMVFVGLVVQQRGAGANVSIDVTAGRCTVQGDDQTDQGMYHIVNDATVNTAMPAVPGATKRIDGIDLRINDPQAGGPAGNNATIVVTQGAVSATPAAPAVPTSAIRLASVLRTAGDSAVTTAMITQLVGRGLWPYTISTLSVPTLLPPRYLYVKT